MTDPEEALKRKLDDVVGKQFDPLDNAAARRERLRKWIAGAVFAVFAVCVIVYTIESHRLPPLVPQPRPKPVVVKIVPSPARPP